VPADVCVVLFDIVELFEERGERSRKYDLFVGGDEDGLGGGW